MANSFLELLQIRPYLVADGAMGTNLFSQGLMSGEAPELWNVDHPERVARVHRGFVEAGSDIVLTNSFGGTRQRLKLHNAQDRVIELNRAAARIARGVADAAGRKVIVGGSIGPTGELFQPLGALSHADAVAAFAEQAQGLAEGGVDVLWIETMSAREEVAAAAEAAAATGLPIVTTMSFDTNARTMMGVTPADFARFTHTLGTRPAAFGANCGVGPGELLDSVLLMAGAAAADDVIIAKGNCGVPQYMDGAIHYSGSPEQMATYARLALDAGARIIGGCCGSSYEHLAAIAGALKAHRKGEGPAIAEVERAFGPVWPTMKASSERGEPRRRSSRR
ncbi:MAG: betaine--homocysteine S-methyltransferase [Proteobacteria bacterium]|nr:betaine--homocysteine S-methyltransferase [Pseudomonadota bacterium]MBI3496817.1 betaine--homocysteine S-methyltransferase [Pseudomonadota bacterium]